MSAQRISFSLNEPFALNRLRESFADWFDSELEVARPTADSFMMDPPEMILVRGAGEFHPATAGAMTGAVAGPAMLGIATLLAHKSHHAVDLPGTVATLVSRGAVEAHWLGWTAVVMLGAMFGTAFAMVTRRLRSFAPMMAFGVILAAASWTVVHALALPRVAPWLAKMLPYGPMVIAAAAFGALLSFQVPVRTRRLV
jgi:hypothetical protein